jgi:hypothetical protein
MRIFTVENGKVTLGVEVDKLHLKGADVDIPAVKIGELGRGRKQGILTVQLSPQQEARWEKGEKIIIADAKVGTTHKGANKLIPTSSSTEELAIFVFRTMIGFRGGNTHTGDYTPEGDYEPFPGDIICSGVIAEGQAGKMGAGEQIIAIIPKGKIFRTAYTGRLYGEPEDHFYRWNGGNQVVSISGRDRGVVDDLDVLG